MYLAKIGKFMDEINHYIIDNYYTIDFDYMIQGDGEMQKKVELKVKHYIYDKLLEETTFYNLGLHSEFSFLGMDYYVKEVNDGNIILELKNNSDFYLENEFSNIAKEINIQTNSVVNIKNLAKPTTIYEIKLLNIKDEAPLLFI